MTHPDPEVLAAVASGEAVPQDLRRHVETCPACARQVAELDGVARRLRDLGAGSGGPGEHVWEAVRTATRPRAPGPAPVREVPPRRPVVAGRRAATLAAAALLGAVVGGGVVGAVTREAPRATAPPTASPSATERSSTLARSVLTPVGGAATSGTVALVRTDRGTRVEVELDTVDDVPAGHYLEVWMFDPRTLDMTSVGVLDGGRGGRFTLPADLDLDAYTGVDVSLEPLDADPAHGASVAQAELGIA